MKKLLMLLLISNVCFGQIVSNYADISNLKNTSQLTPNQAYMIADLGKIEVVAKTSTTFFEKPLHRTKFALDFDEETFNFDTKQIMGIDNISCVARCSNGTWDMINDAGHLPQKIAGVSDNLYVYFSKTYDKLLNFQTSIDETYAQSSYDISCGASVGLSFAAIYFTKSCIVNGQIQKVLMTKNELSIAWSNIFISGRLGKIIQL